MRKISPLRPTRVSPRDHATDPRPRRPWGGAKSVRLLCRRRRVRARQGARPLHRGPGDRGIVCGMAGQGGKRAELPSEGSRSQHRGATSYRNGGRRRHRFDVRDQHDEMPVRGVLRSIGAADVGALITCGVDFAAEAVLRPDWEFRRTQTLMGRRGPLRLPLAVATPSGTRRDTSSSVSSRRTF